MNKYQEYIASPEWARKRKARLEIDGYMCRICDEDGTCYGLEVHHRPYSYKLIPNESIERDLITLCSVCHKFATNLIRRKRYDKRELPDIEIIENKTIERKDINYVEDNDLQVEFVSPVDNAQRTNGRPIEQVVQVTQTDYEKAK